MRVRLVYTITRNLQFVSFLQGSFLQVVWGLFYSLHLIYLALVNGADRQADIACLLVEDPWRAVIPRIVVSS